MIYYALLNNAFIIWKAPETIDAFFIKNPFPDRSKIKVDDRGISYIDPSLDFDIYTDKSGLYFKFISNYCNLSILLN